MLGGGWGPRLQLHLKGHNTPAHACTQESTHLASSSSLWLAARPHRTGALPGRKRQRRSARCKPGTPRRQSTRRPRARAAGTPLAASRTPPPPTRPAARRGECHRPSGREAKDARPREAEPTACAALRPPRRLQVVVVRPCVVGSPPLQAPLGASGGSGGARIRCGGRALRSGSAWTQP